MASCSYLHLNLTSFMFIGYCDLVHCYYHQFYITITISIKKLLSLLYKSFSFLLRTSSAAVLPPSFRPPSALLPPSFRPPGSRAQSLPWMSPKKTSESQVEKIMVCSPLRWCLSPLRWCIWYLDLEPDMNKTFQETITYPPPLGKGKSY